MFPSRKIAKSHTDLAPTLTSLAYAEMRLILCKLLWHFDINLCPGIEHGTWPDQDVYFFWAKPPLLVTLRDRSVEDSLAAK